MIIKKSAVVLGFSIGLSLLLEGCAVLQPFIGDTQSKASAKHKCQACPTPPAVFPVVTYDEALKQATDLTSEITKKRQGLHDFKFWSGASMVGAGIATAGLGAYGANRDLLIGAALVTGTIVGGRTYVPINDRQKIYNTALTSIQDAVQGTVVIETNGQSDGGKSFAASMKIVEVNLERVKVNTALKYFLTQPYFQANTKVASVQTLAAKFNADSNRADLLMKALIKIVNTANNSLVDEVLDPATAIAAATNDIGKARQKVADAKKEAEKLVEALPEKMLIARLLISQQHESNKNSPQVENFTEADMAETEMIIKQLADHLDSIKIEP